MSLATLFFVLASSTASAGTYDADFSAAAAEYQVPETVLMALAYEASRFDPDAASAWGGYGMFDFREDDESFGPGIERVATLIGESPDDIRQDPVLQIRGAAALLAWHASQLGSTSAPAATDVEAWADAIRAFSGREEPELQTMFVTYIYEVMERGFIEDGAMLLPISVDHSRVEAVIPPFPTGDYYGNSQFVNASSSNYSDYSRGPSDISYVVIHTVQGSYSGCISWFQNSSAQVSAHYVVRSSDGAVTQMVWEQDVAWHAGNWSYNLASVGIEHEGYVEDPGTWYTTAMYTGSAALTADIVSRNGISLDRSHIIGHVEVPGATHTDPGSGWDWSYYMSLVEGGGGTSYNAELIGKVADTDIYNGAILVGATVVLNETGETSITDDRGYYHLYNLGTGTYTVTASYNGYDNGSCTKTVESSSGQWWCSVALQPSSGGPVDTGGGGGDDTGQPVDTGDPNTDDSGQDNPPGLTPGARPGGLARLSDMSGRCSTGAGSASGLAALLALSVLIRRR